MDGNYSESDKNPENSRSLHSFVIKRLKSKKYKLIMMCFKDAFT